MTFRLFAGHPEAAPSSTPVELPAPRRARFLKPERYLPDEGLVDAVNVALLMGQPLLLTGEPGTGKTQLAYRLAWELGYGDPLKFETKSTSRAQDLFYTYDALARFRDAQSGAGERDARAYLTYNALGEAVLLTRPPAAVAPYLPPGFAHPGPRRSVVLIDEVDKAPRDFPNDLLNELDELYFRIPELGNARVEAEPDLRPVVVITSNSEKDLPDPFLRRCIYYNIPFPERESGRLAEIVVNRLGVYAGHGGGTFLEDALDLFYALRAPAAGLRKKPATAELLGWMVTLQESADGADNPLRSGDDVVLKTLSTLVKTAEDQENAINVAKRWLEKHR
jgi:MoxR-like ATPase